MIFPDTFVSDSPISQQSRHKILLQALIATRKDKKLTQKQVGERLYQTQSFISKIERGVRKLNPIEFIDFCYALGIDPCQMLKQVTSIPKSRKNRKHNS